MGAIQGNAMQDIITVCSCGRDVLWSNINEIDDGEHIATVIGTDKEGDLHGVYDGDAVQIGISDYSLFICPYCHAIIAFADDRNIWPVAAKICTSPQG